MGASITPEQWIDALDAPLRADAESVRALVVASLPAGYEEHVASGMLTWSVPLSTYPHTYNRQPLAYVAYAARKTGHALYLTGVYQDPEAERRLREAYASAGRRLDLGRSCLRFKRYDDLLAAAVAAEIASRPVEAFIAQHEAARADAGRDG